MHKRVTLRSFAAALLGLALALGIAPLANAAAQYSSIVLNIGADASQRNLVWYSDAASEQVVSVAVKGDDASARTFPTVRTGAANVEGQTFHQATISGLQPETTYVYRVGSEADGWSDAYEFTTGGTSSFEVLMYGDPQIGSGGGIPSDAEAWAATLERSTTNHPGADFLLSMGDQVNTAGDENEYRQFLASDVLREYALATNVGNHDNGSDSYGQHFFMPNSSATVGVPGTPPREGLGNYWYVYNNTLFLSINSNAGTDDEHFAWLREIVAEQGADVDWKVLTFHHGPYSTASHADDRDIIRRRASFPPVISELNIDVVLGGHDHIYSRSHLLNKGHAVGDLSAPGTLAKQPGENLWLTLNSSSGSKYYGEDPIVDQFTFNAVSVQARVPSYTAATITPESIRLVTYQADGTVTDDVTLTRAPADATPNPVPEGEPVVNFWGDGSDPGVGDKPVPNLVGDDGVTTVEARILRPNDDVEEYVETGEMYLDSSDLELTWERPTSETDKEDQLIGLRYDSVQIPAGATVESAYLQFTVDEPNKSVGESNLDIRIETTDHAAYYLLTDGNVSGRSFSEQSVNWQPAEWLVAQEAGAAQATPDLSALVQQVIDRDGWAHGNALSFVITGTGARTAEAYEGGTGAEAPRLFVTYTVADDEPSVSPSPEPTDDGADDKGFKREAPYTLPGLHEVNGRKWQTECELYSQTERCRTNIWATVVAQEGGRYVVKQGWEFNNLTYLPSHRELWAGNPLGDLAATNAKGEARTGEFTSAGRQWRTECDTEATGRGACRSYTMTTVVKAEPKREGGYRFTSSNQWVFNNIVLFDN